MKKQRLVFRIIDKGLTAKRMKSIAELEVVSIGRTPRVIIAAGGAYMFLYGTNGGVPESVIPVAYAFTAIGIIAVLLAIFLPNLIEMRYFTKVRKQGGFPSDVSVRVGGIYLKYDDAEKFAAFSGIRKVDEYKDYFKLTLASPVPCLFLYKEDFELGEPEAFVEFLKSKTEP